MASIESEILRALHSAVEMHKNVSMSTPYSSDDGSIAYQVGLRQGIFNGLTRAARIVADTLEDKVKKDGLL